MKKISSYKRKWKQKFNDLSFVQKNIVLVICCFVLVSLSSIGYAAFQKAINITGDLLLRAPSGVEVSALNFVATSDGMELYNSRFTSDTASISVNIPNVNDKVFYSMTLTNYGDTPMELTSLTPTLSVSDQITCYMYTSSGEFTTGYVLESNSSVSVYIALTRTKIVGTSGTSFSLLIEFEWEEYVGVPSYTEPILVGNDPNLLNNSLVPVIYDETANNGAGSWVVADTTQEWYNYSNQQWANAVILEDGVTKNVGDTVLVPTADSTDTEVRAMYVWIPRYEYKIEGTYGTHTDGTAGTQELPGEIEVNFIPTSQTSASSGYILHPAFQWDNDDNGSISESENIAGIWVGKFETSADTSSTCYTSPSETNCSNGDQEPYILPNVKALTYQTVSNQFITAQKFGTYLSNSSNTDSHMMKNSEWGAVAYLSQSSYGKYGNSNYTGANKEVYKNNSYNSSNYAILTGRSSGLPPASGYSASGTCYYDNITDRADGTGSCGGGASTTGNIYGVYDMSGGAYEYVMGYLTTANSNYESNPNSYFGWTQSSNKAGFTYKPADKYFDNYTETTSATACNGGICYGHALSETSGWYSDRALLVVASNPWLFRGGYYGVYYNATNAGVFGSARSGGYAHGDDSFRSVVLSTGSSSGESSGGSTTPDTPTVEDTIKVSVTNDTTYPWTEYDGLYMSTNRYQSSSVQNNSTTSNLTFSFTTTKTATLSFDWSVSSESKNYDYIYYSIYKDGSSSALSGTGTSTKIGGTSYGGPTTSNSSSVTNTYDPNSDPLTYTTVTKELEAGTYQVTFTYRKDSSSNKGYDAGFVKNFSVSY